MNCADKINVYNLNMTRTGVIFYTEHIDTMKTYVNH